MGRAWIQRSLLALIVAALIAPIAAWSAPAQQPDPGGPGSFLMFVQSGVTQSNTRSYTIGATWNWNWSREYSFGTATGYTEFSVGRWAIDNRGHDNRGGHDWVTQIGITPVIRLHPHSQFADWFVEGGVGVNTIMPIYRSGEQRFSTEFNFGDHIGIGREFGRYDRQEVVLRLQHFSNGGLKEPNPGENFIQVRYSSHY